MNRAGTAGQKTACRDGKQGKIQLLREYLKQAMKNPSEIQQRRGKEWAQKRNAFIGSPFGFTKKLPAQNQTGHLACPEEKMGQHVHTTISDALRDHELGPCSEPVAPPEPGNLFNSVKPTLKEVKESVCVAISAPSSSGFPYKVNKHCSQPLKQL